MAMVKVIKIKEVIKKDKFPCLTYLNEESKKKVLKYKRDNNAYLSLLGELLRREMLCSYLDCSNEDLQFYINEYGKPFVNADSQCFFNISHSGQYVVCIVDKNMVGIDVEKNAPRECLCAMYMFHEEELKALEQIKDTKELNDYFYFLWTMKEAYLKAIGTGMAKTLSSFIVERNSNNQIQIKDCDPMLDGLDNFESFVVDDYTISTVSCSDVSITYMSDEKFINELSQCKYFDKINRKGESIKTLVTENKKEAWD